MDRPEYLLTALKVRIDDHLGKPARIGRPPRLADAELLSLAVDATWVVDSTPVECPLPRSRQTIRVGRQLVESANQTLNANSTSNTTTPPTIDGVTQRLLAMTAAIWHNRTTSQPTTRPLIAFDH